MQMTMSRLRPIPRPPGRPYRVRIVHRSIHSVYTLTVTTLYVCNDKGQVIWSSACTEFE